MLGILRQILARGRGVAPLTFATLVLLMGLAAPAHAGPTPRVDAPPIPVIVVADSVEAGPLPGPYVVVIACHVQQSAGRIVYAYAPKSPFHTKIFGA